MGTMTKKEVFDLLDFFHKEGGNFIDTANNYQNEESELWIGEWMTSRKVRDQMVVATKFTTGYRVYQRPANPDMIQANYIGNNSKSLRLSLEASLAKLQTDYLDILYVHWWDFTTSIPELMQSLNSMVERGKVLYLGVSDTPAWIVSKANEYARNNGLRQFVVYQGRWNAALRDFERDIVPMAAAEGMGLAPWDALGGGNFKTPEQYEKTKGEGRRMGERNENYVKVSKVLDEVAQRKKTHLVSVAMAYVMHKAPYVFPLIGGRKIEHLKGNIEALGLELDQKDIEEIEAATDFDIGFPLNFLGRTMPKDKGAKGPADVFLTNAAANFDYVQGNIPIQPKKKE